MASSPRLHPVDETAAVAYRERRYSSDYRLYRLGTDARSREWFIVLGGDDDDLRGDMGMRFPTVRLYPGRGTSRQKTMSPVLNAIMHQQPVPHIYIADLTIHVDTVDADNVGQRRKQEGDGVGALLVHAVQQLARDTTAAYVRGELAERDAFPPRTLGAAPSFLPRMRVHGADVRQARGVQDWRRSLGADGRADVTRRQRRGQPDGQRGRRHGRDARLPSTTPSPIFRPLLLWRARLSRHDNDM